jgi:hypothetical protein
MKYLVAITVAVALALPGSARADERVLPKGTEVRTPDGKSLRLDASHFLLERDTVDWANAQAATNRRLSEQLQKCREETAKPEPGWSKWQWAGAGGAVVVAFLAGLKLGGI